MDREDIDAMLKTTLACLALDIKLRLGTKTRGKIFALGYSSDSDKQRAKYVLGCRVWNAAVR